MTLVQYFKRFKTNTIHIIGPFFDGETLPSEPLIFIDRGAEYRKSSEGFSVGDGDSTDRKLDLLLDQKKDFSDLAFVLQSIPKSFKKIILLGFLGHRKDHELMNFAEVHSFLKKKKGVEVRFDRSVVAFPRGKWSIEVHGVFSLFSFESVKLKLTGNCDYKIDGKKKFQALSSHGLSNHGQGEIKISCDRPVFVFLNYVRKTDSSPFSGLVL